MLALILMMPLLCLFADLIAIAGGFLVSTLMLDITPALYLHRTVEAITLARSCWAFSRARSLG